MPTTAIPATAAIIRETARGEVPSHPKKDTCTSWVLRGLATAVRRRVRDFPTAKCEWSPDLGQHRRSTAQVSRTRHRAGHNTRVIGGGDDAIAQLAALRAESPSAVGVGGAALATQLLRAQLLDELVCGGAEAALTTIFVKTTLGSWTNSRCSATPPSWP